MADKKTKYKTPTFTAKEAEDAILKMQDLVMKVAQYHGLENYSIGNCLQKFGELKNDIKYKVEDALNYPKMDHSSDVAATKGDGTKMVKLNLNSGKKYSF